MQIGDLVSTPDGGSAPVTEIVPLGVRDIYRIHFSDRTSAECTDDHLWSLQSWKFKGERVLPLSYISSKAESWRSSAWIPITAPVKFAPQDVPIDPYLLGALIGDGSLLRSVMFSCDDDYIVQRVGDAVPAPYELLKKSDQCAPWQYRISAPRDTKPEDKGLQRDLRALGLWGHKSPDKFIPDVYKYNTEDVRWEVLRGIFDADGWVQRGQPQLGITAPRLALDVIEIVQSLGGTGRMTVGPGGYKGKDGVRIECKPVYRCNFSHQESHKFFALPRKREKCSQRIQSTKRTLRHVEFSRRAEAMCIEVGSPEGLFMTNDFIVTHNTVTCLAWLLEQALKLGGPGKSFWWVAPVYNQAEIGYRRMELQIPPKLVRPNASKLRLTLTNGALIEFKSAERAKALYGDDVFAAVMDECSHMREDAWDAVLSTVTATGGQIRLIGNVRGRKNWFYKMARIAEAGDPDMSYAKITAYEAIAEGVLTEENVEMHRRRYEKQGRLEHFRELYLAEPSEAGGNPFGLGAIDDCVGELSQNPPRVAGIDFAGRGAINATDDADRRNLDWTAVVLLDKDGAATHIERFRLPNAETMVRVEQIVGRVPALGDSTGAGDMMVELLQRRGKMNLQGYVFNNRTKQDLMENLAVMIQNKHLRFPDGDLRDELDAFEFEYGTNSVKYAAAPGHHDDLVVALSLAAFKLPKHRSVGAPMGIAGASRWNSDPAAAAWAKYVATTKPTESPPAEAVEGADKPITGAPQIISGSESGKWR